MSFGMFSHKENSERLDRIEKKLKKARLDPEERAQLEEWKKELQAWFREQEIINP